MSPYLIHGLYGIMIAFSGMYSWASRPPGYNSLKPKEEKSMKIQISKRTELMMAQAVALAQNGRMKSHIHGSGPELYVANMDNTIIISFSPDMSFPAALDFFANDYESPNIEIDGGQVSFITTHGTYKQKKTCGCPKTTFNEVRDIYAKYRDFDRSTPVVLNKDVLSLLNNDLSHVEFHSRNGSLLIMQKNIYTGGRIEIISANEAKSLIKLNALPANFRPLGLRTADLTALFSFTNTLTLYPQPGKNWMAFQDAEGVMTGVIATCVYDELGYITDAASGVTQETPETPDDVIQIPEGG